jgi:hypothetical protein
MPGAAGHQLQAGQQSTASVDNIVYKSNAAPAKPHRYSLRFAMPDF